MSKSISDELDKQTLKIGDKLYRYTGTGIFSYDVQAVVERKVGTLYEIACNECRDHEQCVLLIAESKENHGYRFIDMVTEESQSYWHTDNDPYQRYERTKKLAMIRRNESLISYLEKQVEKLEKSIEANKKKIKEATAIIEGLSDE
jgi:predicted ribosome quality control (RQC) complex YloA/Tae2 family protein